MSKKKRLSVNRPTFTNSSWEWTSLDYAYETMTVENSISDDVLNEQCPVNVIGQKRHEWRSIVASRYLCEATKHIYHDYHCIYCGKIEMVTPKARAQAKTVIETAESIKEKWLEQYPDEFKADMVAEAIRDQGPKEIVVK